MQTQGKALGLKIFLYVEGRERSKKETGLQPGNKQVLKGNLMGCVLGDHKRKGLPQHLADTKD